MVEEGHAGALGAIALKAGQQKEVEAQYTEKSLAVHHSLQKEDLGHCNHRVDLGCKDHRFCHPEEHLHLVTVAGDLARIRTADCRSH